MEEIIEYLESKGFDVGQYDNNFIAAELSNEGGITIKIYIRENVCSIFLEYKIFFIKDIAPRIIVESVDILQMILKNSLYINLEFGDLFQ